MKVSGFTFIKDALIYDYPIVEAIRSILPICDEMIVAVGESRDETFNLIQQINDEKIKIIPTIWNEELREGGKVLAEETNKAFKAISQDSDWAFYIQGDEIIHENDLDIIVENMQKFKNHNDVDGLLFNYLHFYGSYDYVGTSSNWYKNEIRVIKNNKKIYSYRDAQGFRKNDNEKLNVVPINASVYHYGWVKEPKAMQKKQENFNKYWHADDWIEKNVVKVENYEYEKHIKELARFNGDHAKVMEQRIKLKNWAFEHDLSYNKKSIKDKTKDFARKYLKLDFSYKNYKLIKTKKI